VAKAENEGLLLGQVANRKQWSKFVYNRGPILRSNMKKAFLQIKKKLDLKFLKYFI